MDKEKERLEREAIKLVDLYSKTDMDNDELREKMKDIFSRKCE